MKVFQVTILALALGFSATASRAGDKTAPLSEVEIHKDVSYVPNSDSEKNKLDLYLPKGKKDYPVLLFLHGGGFSKGDRKEVGRFGATLARHNIGVAAAGYRLLPEAKHPGQIQDSARAFAWLHQNIAQYGGNPEQIFVGGHSAGGLLAALLASDETYLKSERGSISDIRGVVSLSGAYRIPEQRKDVFGDEEARKQAAPIGHVKPGLPAFFLAYAEKDAPGRDKETLEFAQLLKSNKVEAVVYEAKERDHGTLFTAIEDGEATGDALIQFIQKHAAAKSANTRK